MHSQKAQAIPVPDIFRFNPAKDIRVVGRHVRMDGEDFYCIENPDRMPEFFMSLVSSGDHWMFVSSRGAVTAGRSNPDQAIFPYYSADKLADLRKSAGPLTIIRVNRNGSAAILWEPFSGEFAGSRNRQQKIYKNAMGNRLWFEETNDSLGLVIRYRWSFGKKFGFVRTCQILNIGSETLELDILDGLKNILPAGLGQQFQLRFSNLADAYKKSELEPGANVAVYYLNSVPTDLAEPSEGLRATVVWSTGLDQPTFLLSDRQVDCFRQKGTVERETDLRGQRGCWFAHQSLRLQPSETAIGAHSGSTKAWDIVIDTGFDQSDVIDLEQAILNSAGGMACELKEDIADCENQLSQILACADGIQLGSNRLRNERHLSNTIFNVMRGGIPADGYRIHSDWFSNHLRQVGPAVYRRNREFLEGLESVLENPEFLNRIGSQNDPDLLRLGLEYLPFCYSRRHGDPTRPWNAFSIDLKNDDGTMRLNYQGNWRDIFQNWEALAMAYPSYCPKMILRFVNASTADGYNPYRISSSGFEWETPDENDPWSNIGYWGDHQIIYLLKLVELGRRFEPHQLNELLDRDVCVYANIPYRICEYRQIRENPRETVAYDSELAAWIASREYENGNEAKLLTTTGGELVRANLAEKLLVSALAKMANFVPEGGIWLTTQRPEWNDANNALAGYGLSVVTACYLRRYCDYLVNWFGEIPVEAFSISSEVANWMIEMTGVLREHVSELAGLLTARERRQIVDRLGLAGSSFRESLYENGLSGDKTGVAVSQFLEFFRSAREFLDHTIRFNKRADGLFHSFNLLNYETGGSEDRIVHLHEMLEGQVAVLSSGLLSAEECVCLLDALRSSTLFRADQQSYMLSPDRVLPRFTEKNCLADADINRSALLKQLVLDGNRSIIKRDVRGGLHFNGDFRNAKELAIALNSLANAPQYSALVETDRQTIIDLFERVFQHHEFTGRSGSFFGYEGLGSVYWHMVSKLLLAVQENLLKSKASSCPRRILDRMRTHYGEIREGLGLNKNPVIYGAFPTDPYSHTPKHAGAQQPGMTGQVKEDLLVRMAEIGVRVEGGCVSFDPWLFERAEMLAEPAVFRYYDVRNNRLEIQLPENSFAFTFCQVPIIYQVDEEPGIRVYLSTGANRSHNTAALDVEASHSLFSRNGAIAKIVVRIAAASQN